MKLKTEEDAISELIAKIEEKEISFDIVYAISGKNDELAEKVSNKFDKPLSYIEVSELTVNSENSIRIGAVAEDGTLWVEDEVRDSFNISAQDIENAKLNKVNNAEFYTYSNEEIKQKIKNKKILLIDKGAHDRSRLMAALGFLKKRSPSSLAVAMPVASRNVFIDINQVSDQSLIIDKPRYLNSINSYYGKEHA